jgi:hypothetical protein
MELRKMEIYLSRMAHYFVKKLSGDMLVSCKMSASDYKHSSNRKIEYRNEYETSIDKISKGN